MSYADICWNFLQKHGFITAWQIHILTRCTAPHGVIRDIRKKYGYDILTFKDVKKTNTYIENGKEKRETKTYRIWYLNREGMTNGIHETGNKNIAAFIRGEYKGEYKG